MGGTLKSQIRQIKSEKISLQRHGFLSPRKVAIQGTKGKPKSLHPPGHHQHQTSTRSQCRCASDAHVTHQATKESRAEFCHCRRSRNDSIELSAR